VVKEWAIQRRIYEYLAGKGFDVFADKQRPSENWMPKTFGGDRKRPDLIFFHRGAMSFTDPSDRGFKLLPDPICVEIKVVAHAHQVTNAIWSQLECRYKDREYTCGEWTGGVGLRTLATDRSILDGCVYGPNHEYIKNEDMSRASDFWIARWLWRMDMGLIVNLDGRWYLSYQEDGSGGQGHGRFGQRIPLER